MPSPPQLASDLAGVVQRIRGLYADALEMVGELDRTGAVQSLGYASLTALLGDLLRVAPAQARRMIRHTEQVTETLTPTGHRAPAPLPLAREALRAGDLDAEHLDAIADAVRKIPTWAPAGTTGIVETALVHTARTAHPGLVRRHGEILLARIDQDGPTPDPDDDTGPHNSFRYRRTRAGRMQFSGDIDPEAAEELDSLLGALGKPDGPEDRRSVPHRLGDAFATVVHRAVDDPDLPVRGGEKPHLNVFLDLPTLTEGVGHATLEGGGTLSAEAARRLACDANLIPIVLNGQSVPLDLGRTHRLVPLTAAHRAHRPRPGLRLPRLRPPGPLGGRPPRPSLGRRRPHRPRQPRAALPPPPPARPPLRLGHPHGGRDTRARPTRLAGPPPHATPQHHAPLSGVTVAGASWSRARTASPRRSPVAAMWPCHRRSCAGGVPACPDNHRSICGQRVARLNKILFARTTWKWPDKGRHRCR